MKHTAPGVPVKGSPYENYSILLPPGMPNVEMEFMRATPIFLVRTLPHCGHPLRGSAAKLLQPQLHNPPEQRKMLNAYEASGCSASDLVPVAAVASPD